MESQNARWLLTSSAGPVAGMFSSPLTFGRKSSFTNGATKNRLRNRYSIVSPPSLAPTRPPPTILGPHLVRHQCSRVATVATAPAPTVDSGHYVPASPSGNVTV